MIVNLCNAPEVHVVLIAGTSSESNKVHHAVSTCGERIESFTHRVSWLWD